jgi:hypothetical protein
MEVIMGRKMRWFKMRSNDYLADTALRRLTLAEHGLYNILINYMRTQTEEPGVITIEIDEKFSRKIYQIASDYSTTVRAYGLRRVALMLKKMIALGLFEQRNSESLVCPTILKDYEESREMTKRNTSRTSPPGDKKGHHPGNHPGHQKGNLHGDPESETESETDAQVTREEKDSMYEPGTRLSDL